MISRSDMGSEQSDKQSNKEERDGEVKELPVSMWNKMYKILCKQLSSRDCIVCYVSRTSSSLHHHDVEYYPSISTKIMTHLA